jgi:hypothetical protein
MSDDTVTLSNQKRGKGDIRDREPDARLKWITDVVSAILDARSSKRLSSLVRDPGTIK